MAGMRLQPRQLTVAYHATNEQPRREQRQSLLQRQILGVGKQRIRHAAQGQGEQAQKKEPFIPIVAVKAEDKTEQVKSERKHPQKRNRGDVLRKVIRNSQQQSGSAGGQ